MYRWDGEKHAWQNMVSPFPILHVAVGSDREVWAIIDDEKDNSATKLSNVAMWNGKTFTRVPGKNHIMYSLAAISHSLLCDKAQRG